MTLASLWERRIKLRRQYEEHVGCGCGSSTVEYFERLILEIEQEILAVQDFRCPHCHKSLEYLRIENYVI